MGRPTLANGGIRRIDNINVIIHYKPSTRSTLHWEIPKAVTPSIRWSAGGILAIEFLIFESKTKARRQLHLQNLLATWRKLVAEFAARAFSILPFGMSF